MFNFLQLFTHLGRWLSADAPKYQPAAVVSTLNLISKKWIHCLELTYHFKCTVIFQQQTIYKSALSPLQTILMLLTVCQFGWWISATILLQCLHLCPIHVVTFTLISKLATDYIQKRRGEPDLFSFEYNLLPNLIST